MYYSIPVASLLVIILQPIANAFGQETGNLQLWQESVFGVNAPAVLQNPIGVYTVTNSAQQFPVLKSALQASCDAFVLTCISVATRESKNLGECTSAHTQCLTLTARTDSPKSLPNSTLSQNSVYESIQHVVHKLVKRQFFSRLIQMMQDAQRAAAGANSGQGRNTRQGGQDNDLPPANLGEQGTPSNGRQRRRRGQGRNQDPDSSQDGQLPPPANLAEQGTPSNGRQRRRRQGNDQDAQVPPANLAEENPEGRNNQRRRNRRRGNDQIPDSQQQEQQSPANAEQENSEGGNNQRRRNRRRGNDQNPDSQQQEQQPPANAEQENPGGNGGGNNQRRRNRRQGNDRDQGNNNPDQTPETPNPGAGQQNPGNGANAAAFCAGVGMGNAIADGTQKRTPTCSVTVQGVVPSFDRMVSSVILSPRAGAEMEQGAQVTVRVRTNNMELGLFDDPQTRYYMTPQTVNAQGIIQGHQHVSVQRMGNGQTPPDPRSEALTFFKGLDQQAENGVLETVIPANTFNEPGMYRICTITGTRAHQPVIMPVARRGSQDDCIRVNVT